jgi:hypothetical protein
VIDFRLFPIVAAAALTGCSTDADFDWQPIPGTGWSRAPDLSVYSAMTEFATIAREQEMLCQGFGPESVLVRWERQYGAREDYVRASLVVRHGSEAVTEAEAEAVATRRVPCRDYPYPTWRYRYARLLRLLEVRLATS